MSKKTKLPAGEVASVHTGWTQAVFMCRKCSKKLDGGFGPDGEQTLRQALRETLRQRGQRGQVGLIEVGCLGICPKGAVTISRTAAPGEFLLVARGTSASTVLDR
jgi:predicted metal-binding protein